MAVNKPLTLVAGVITEVTAPATSAGAGDAGKMPALDSNGRLDASFMPSGIAAESAAIVTSEALAAGDLVNIWTSTGTKARKADATTPGKEAMGFVNAAFGSGATATVFFPSQTDTGQTGLTVGPQYLSATAGLATATAPTASGQFVQRVGFAYSSTQFVFQPGPAITLA